MHIPLFGLDHLLLLLLLLFLFLLPYSGSVAVLKLSHKVWADSLTGSWTHEDCIAIRSKIRYQVRLSITRLSSNFTGLDDFTSLFVDTRLFLRITQKLHHASTHLCRRRNHWPELGMFAFTVRILTSRALTVLCCSTLCSLPNCFTISVKNGFHVSATSSAVLSSRGVQIEAKHSPRTLQKERNVV